MKQPRPAIDMLICLPTYNEHANVDGLVSRILALPLAADILFIDDDSPDGTGTLLDELARRQPAVRVIHRSRRQGIGSAHRAAVRFGYRHGYRLLVTMDADGTHAPEDIPRMVEKAATGEVVIGSRFLSDSIDRRRRREVLQSRLVHRLASWLLNVSGDMSNAFRLYRLDRIDPGLFSKCRSDSYAFFPESLYRLHQADITCTEIPIRLDRRMTGKSKMRLRDVGEWLYRLLFLRGRSGRLSC